jgi:hypothetical protein
MQAAENMTDRNARARTAINFSVTTRDELEAVIWRLGVRSAVAVEAILLAADEYATAQCVTAICAQARLAADQARHRAALDAALAAIELRGRYERKAA